MITSSIVTSMTFIEVVDEVERELTCSRPHMIFERHRTSTTRDGNEATASTHCFSAMDRRIKVSARYRTCVSRAHLRLQERRHSATSTDRHCIFFPSETLITHKSSFIGPLWISFLLFRETQHRKFLSEKSSDRMPWACCLLFLNRINKVVSYF